MSTIDLSAITLDDLVFEVKYRLNMGSMVTADLGFEPDMEKIANETLVQTINARLATGDIDASSIELGDDDEEENEAGGGMDELDPNALDEAAVRFRRRDYTETLWELEKGLGPNFAGLSDFKLERR